MISGAVPAIIDDDVELFNAILDSRIEVPTSKGLLVVVETVVVGLLGARRDNDCMPWTSGMGDEGIRKTAGARMGTVDRFVAECKVFEVEGGREDGSSELPG